MAAVLELTSGLEAYGLAVFGGPEIAGLSHSIIDGCLVVEARFTAAGAAFGADPLKQRLDLWQEVWDPGR